MDLRELINVGQADVSTLYLDSSVNSVVISAYLRLVERRSFYFRTKNTLKVWVFETTFWKDWNEGDLEKIKESIGTVELFKKDVLFVPLHISCAENADHWCLVVIRIKKFEINAFDSLGLDRTKELASVFKFLQVYSKSIGNDFNPDQWIIKDTPTNCPKQLDTISSGVYMCMIAERISRNIDPTSQPIENKNARRSILGNLRRERLNKEDFTLFDAKKWWVGERYCGKHNLSLDQIFYINGDAKFLIEELFSHPKRRLT